MPYAQCCGPRNVRGLDCIDLGSHKSGFVGKTKDYAGRDAQVGCRANARPPLSRYL